MPYCTACGEEVKETHYYCGQCGESLTDRAENNNGPPPMRMNSGFLSGRSLEYVNTAYAEGIDENHPGYARLEQDIVSGIIDFSIVGALDGVNILTAVFSQYDNIRDEKRQKLLLLGLWRLPRLFDQSIGTDWEEEFNTIFNDLIEEVNKEISGR